MEGAGGGTEDSAADGCLPHSFRSIIGAVCSDNALRSRFRTSEQLTLTHWHKAKKEKEKYQISRR